MTFAARAEARMQIVERFPDQNNCSKRSAWRLTLPSRADFSMMIAHDQNDAKSKIPITILTTISACMKRTIGDKLMAGCEPSGADVGITSIGDKGAADGAGSTGAECGPATERSPSDATACTIGLRIATMSWAKASALNSINSSPR
jgi:hypothetical protein